MKLDKEIFSFNVFLSLWKKRLFSYFIEIFENCA